MEHIMRYVCSILSLIITLTSFSLHAGWHSPNNKMGFKITPVLPDNANWSLNSGDIYTFQGEVCVVQWWHHNQNEKCQKLKTRYQNLRFFYPDALTEVTDQVEVEEVNGKKSLKYSFTTSELQGDAPNTLTVLVGSERNEIEKLLKTKAKLQKRIAILQDLRDRKYFKHSRARFFSEYINRMITILSASIEGIERVIDQDPQVLAKLSQPLQVDNQIAGPLHYSSNFSGHRLALTIPLGSPIEGESTQVSATVTNLSHLNFNFPMLYAHTPDNDDEVEDDNAHQYEMALRFNGQEMFSLESLSLAVGESHTETRDIGPLSPNDPNLFELELTKTFKFKFFNHRAKRKWGAISLAMPVSPDEVAPVISETTHSAIRYTQHMPLISAKIADEFGRLDSSTFKLIGAGALIDSTASQKDFSDKLQLTNLDLGRAYSVLADLNPIEEGEWALNFSGKDFAGNEATHSHVVRIDRTNPVIALGNSDNTLTNNPSYTLPVIVDDHSPITVQIFHNGNQVLVTEESIFDLNVTLAEGVNTFEVRAIDAAGNVAVPSKLNSVELDTIPPEIAYEPADGSTIFSLDFLFKASSNEDLSLITVNGVNHAPESRNFEKVVTSAGEGFFDVVASFYDLAGNETSLDLTYEILLKVLNGDLITIIPKNNGKLEVRGGMFAAKPGITVEIDGGFFNSKEVVANSDGTFSVEMDFFTAVNLYAEDEASGRSDSVYMQYNVDTTLSGVVKDIEGNPLRGVTVKIIESNQEAVTDGTGAFNIVDPATGDKTLAIDGTTIPVEVSGPNKKFSQTNIAVAIGTTQRNVIEFPIYLAPLMFDGTETQIEDGAGAIVTSSHAPGVELDIPAGTVTFPDGGNAGDINILEMSSEFASVPVPEFAAPEKIYAFEPSGVKFSEPVKLTLPNSYNMPEGAQLVILSKNSVKGIYEIDGLARVDVGGATVTTEEGSGITHFSEIYMAPLGPKFKQFAGSDKPGADTFNGAVSTSVQLPSFKTMGNDIAPGLSYKSLWANPNILISNLFDVPRGEFSFDIYLGGVRKLLGKADAKFVGTGYYQPSYLDVQFSSNNIVSEKMRFTGLPNKSVVSYAMDLSSQDSGIQPFQSKYEMKLNQILIGSIETRSKSLFGGTRVSREPHSETRELEKVFPSDISGGLVVQNKKDSSAGKGWRLNMGSQIHSKGGARVVLERADGSPVVYAQTNTIETIYEGQGTFNSANLDKGNNLLILDEGNKIKEYDVASQVASERAIIPNLTGRYSFSHQTGSNHCDYFYRNFTRPRRIEQMLELPSGDIYMSDSFGHILKYSDQVSVVAGSYQGIPTNVFREGNFCGWDGVSCSQHFGLAIRVNCWTPPPSVGAIQANGFQDGALGSSYLNTPKGMAAGQEAGTLLVADYGNNRIRKINLVTNAIETFAGNGQTYDNGDNGPAASASLYHPQGLATDGAGNLYVTTERGYIRKIDPTGRIETYAGKLIQDGGLFADTAQAEEMNFNAPYGMVIDQDRQIMYVADMGYHRIVAIDMVTKVATTIAGSGQCVGSGDIGDGKAALLASLCHPKHLGLDEAGNLLVFDSGHNKVRRISFGSVSGQEIILASEANDNSQLIKQADGSFRLEYRSGAVDRFDVRGNLVESQDRIGRLVNYEYDIQDRLLKVIDQVGSEIIYNYAGDKLASILDPAGRETFMYYDGDLLSEIVFPDNSTKRYEYNQLGLMTAEYDQRGNKIQYLYNEWNRLWKVVRPDNSEIVVQDKGSHTIGNNYTGGVAGTLKSLDGEAVDGIKDAKGVETIFSSDENGYVSKITDGEGRVTEMVRDDQGRVTKVIRPDQSVAEFVYAPVTGDLVSKTDNGLTTTYQFNSFGDLLRQENSLGQWIENVYEAGSGLLLSSSNHVGQITSATYNEAGLLDTRTNAIGATTSYGYGQYLNLASVTDALNNSTTFERDAAGNVIKTTNAKGQFTQSLFDLFNRLLSVTDARGNTTNYQYLSTGELSKIIDPRGNQTLFAYNSLGQMVEKTDPLGFKTALSYDLNGNVLSELDPNGNLKTFEYNSRDELVKKVLPDNIYEMTYDSYGNLESISDKNSLVEFVYVRLFEEFKVEEEIWTGRGELSDMGSHVLTHDYNSLGLVTNTSTLAGNFGYVYDNANRLSALLNPFNEEFQFDFDLANRLTKISRPGSVTHHVFDVTNFLTEIRHENLSGDVIGKFEYARDAIGNRTAMRSPAGENQFNYDPDQQITSSIGPDVGSESFQYDELGNRMQDVGGAYVYGVKRQRLIEDYRHFYYYDNNGNLSSKISKDMTKTENYHYSSENQLIKIEWFENNVQLKEARYSFDALGRRMQKVVIDHQNSTDKTRRFAYIGQEVIAQLDENNTVLAVYTPSGLRTDDTLSVKLTSAGIAAGLGSTSDSLDYLKDGLGSITHLANSNGVVKERYLYSAFGTLREILDESGVATTTPILEPYHSYTNREFDEESGLYFYRARVYDPSIGRFLQSDPDPGKRSLPITHINKYIYAGNNPIVFDDPSGTSFLKWAGEKLLWSAAAIGYLTLVGVTSGADPATAFLGAAVAVGATAAGSAVAAGVLSLAQGGDFSQNFMRSFDRIYATSLIFLAVASSYAGATSGGPIGYGAGAGGLQGQVYGSAGGGLSLGPAAYAGRGTSAHEAGHLFQFAGIAGIQGFRARQGRTNSPIGSLYRTYLIIGAGSAVIGNTAQALGGTYDAWYNPFEWSATRLGF